MGKIINDPVFGFINVDTELMMEIISNPIFQRLGRIKQMGLSSAVYPGAQHTRLQHSLGAYHLMCEAINSLRLKGNFIFESEEEAVKAAILLHDVGHGPFSHVLENTLVRGISHEDISLELMEIMNQQLRSELNLAITVFRNEYPKLFLHQLISSQLDMDRLDYLRRDSFFTGVTEGNIGSARIIKMLNVHNDHLVVERKGIYSVENYLMSRRLMYWQVYLHKTSVSLERVLINTLLRAKHLYREGRRLFAAPQLAYFLENDVDRDFWQSHEECIHNYLLLDDSDIWSALKTWSTDEDRILSMLAQDLINRNIFRVEVFEEPASEEYVTERRKLLASTYGIDYEDTIYLISEDRVQKDMYSMEDDAIEILFPDGSTKDICDVSDMLNIDTLSKKVRKYYFCSQRLP